MTRLEGKAFRCAALTAIPALRAEPVMGREPIEVARAVLSAARKHGRVELYVDGAGYMAIRDASVVYADDLPALWLVGAYNAKASTVHIMEDLALRLAEVRAARGQA